MVFVVQKKHCSIEVAFSLHIPEKESKIYALKTIEITHANAPKKRMLN